MSDVSNFEVVRSAVGDPKIHPDREGSISDSRVESSGSISGNDHDPFADCRMPRRPERLAEQANRGDRFAPPKEGRTTEERLKIEGQDRHFFVHTPGNYDPRKPTALVLVFNGYGASTAQGGAAAGGAGMEAVTGFSRKADQQNFIVVYMDGSQREHSWNNGQWWFSKENDLLYTDSVIKKLQSNLNIDQNRIYAAGFSQGGSFVHRLASEMPGRFAAIATNSSWMSGQERPAAVSALHLHSADDSTVPTTGRKWWLNMQPLDAMKQHYVAANQITEKPTVTTVATARGPVVMETSVNRATGIEFAAVTVQQEGHQWLGGKGNEEAPARATDIIWDFFQRHTRSH